MVVGTAKSMGITVSGDAPFLIKRKTWQRELTKKSKEYFKN
jgi:hypothetical protein